MVRIAITVEAFEAIARTLPLGSVAVDPETNERGERYVWLDHAVVTVSSHARAGRELQRRDPAGGGSDLIGRPPFGRASRPAFLRNQTLHSAVEFAVILPKERHLLDQIGKHEPYVVGRLQTLRVTLVMQADAQSIVQC
jgi:hypothetical protein